MAVVAESDWAGVGVGDDPRIEAALDAVITLDVRGCIVEWNHAAVSTFGYEREEVYGCPLADLIVPVDLRAAHTAALARCAETGAGAILGTRVELRAVSKSGREFPVELTVTTYVSRQQRYFTAYLRDITDRHRRATYSKVLELAGRILLENPLDPNERLKSVPGLLVPGFAPFAAVAAATGGDRPEVLSVKHALSPALLAHAVLSGRSATTLWADALSGDAGFTLIDVAAARAAGTPSVFLRETLAVSALAVCRIAASGLRAAILCGASDGGFSEDDQTFLRDFCRRAELAVENAAVYREQARLTELLESDDRRCKPAPPSPSK
jgi:PAS domain S-box-containing protein